MDKFIPYIVFEADMARFERIIKRLWITVILLIVLLVGSNIAWLIYESQFEDFTITQETENESGDIMLNGTGEITINGQGETDN